MSQFVSGSLPADIAADLLQVLASRELTSQHRELLDRAAARCGGSEAWRKRKLAEARCVAALCQLAPPGRLFVLALDLSVDLTVHIHLGVPVPVSVPGQQVETVRHARMVIRCPEALLDQELPGTDLIRLTFPGHDVWHPCVAGGHRQTLALAERFAVGTTLVELILQAYEVLSMRALAADPWNCRNVLNPDALAWWQRHLFRIPLTTRPFFENDAPSS